MKNISISRKIMASAFLFAEEDEPTPLPSPRSRPHLEVRSERFGIANDPTAPDFSSGAVAGAVAFQEFLVARKHGQRPPRLCATAFAQATQARNDPPTLPSSVEAPPVQGKMLLKSTTAAATPRSATESVLVVADPNSEATSDESTLVEMCALGRPETDIVARIRASVDDVNATDPVSRRTALHYAGSQGAHAVVVALLQAGSDARATCALGRTALDDAVAAEHWGVAKLLLWTSGDAHVAACGASSAWAAAGDGLCGNATPPVRLEEADSRPLGVALPACGAAWWVASSFDPADSARLVRDDNRYIGAAARAAPSSTRGSESTGSVLLEQDDPVRLRLGHHDSASACTIL